MVTIATHPIENTSGDVFPDLIFTLSRIWECFPAGPGSDSFTALKKKVPHLIYQGGQYQTLMTFCSTAFATVSAKSILISSLNDHDA